MSNEQVQSIEDRMKKFQGQINSRILTSLEFVFDFYILIDYTDFLDPGSSKVAWPLNKQSWLQNRNKALQDWMRMARHF